MRFRAGLNEARLLCAALLAGCTPAASNTDRDEASAPAAHAAYSWTRLTAAADFPKRYNFPVHTLFDGRFAALHPEGLWLSRDGIDWVKTAGPLPGSTSPYLPYVYHRNASWALGSMTGDYRDFKVDPVIRRTGDHQRWQEVGRSGTMPRTIFPAAASFDGALWLLGGYDGTRANAQVWRSTDGLDWQQVSARAPWSARAGAKAIVFRDRLFIIGGGEVDGAGANDVWSSPDGIEWRLETASIAAEKPVGYTPVVFDSRLWLVGANRSGEFTSEMLVSDTGGRWEAVRAPWSPRGAVAAWTDGTTMFITGGKYSVERNGEQLFIYSNDVWAMRRSAPVPIRPGEDR
jgi:hypothetical protein